VDLWRLLTVASAEELRPIVEGTPAQPFLDPDNARMFGSIRSVTGSAIAALEYIQCQRAAPFSVRQWVKTDSYPSMLFIPYRAGQIAALRSIIATWMRLAIFEAMNQIQDHDQRLWFVVDELDALGRARGAYGQLAGHDEREQALNQLLSEIDGFDPSVGLVLLGATNRPEILDPELLRAGRFDRQVLVDRPDKAGRIQILKIYLGKIRLGSDAAAIERILAGLEKKNRLLSPKEREIVAYHEMGHALVALILPGVDRVQKVSIIPRGVGALDYTIQRPTEDRFLLTEDELENQDGGAARPPGGRAPGLRQSIDRCGRRSRQSVRYRPQLRRPIWDGSGIGRVGL